MTPNRLPLKHESSKFLRLRRAYGGLISFFDHTRRSTTQPSRIRVVLDERCGTDPGAKGPSVARRRLKNRL